VDFILERWAVVAKAAQVFEAKLRNTLFNHHVKFESATQEKKSVYNSWEKSKNAPGFTFLHISLEATSCYTSSARVKGTYGLGFLNCNKVLTDIIQFVAHFIQWKSYRIVANIFPNYLAQKSFVFKPKEIKKVTKGALLNEWQCFGIFAEQFYLTFYGFLIGFDAKRRKIAFHSQLSNVHVSFLQMNHLNSAPIAYLWYNIKPTTLQSMVNAKLSQQGFSSAISKSVSRRFQTIPRNLYAWVSR